MTDPAADAARAAATALAGSHGPSLAAQVEAALAARDQPRPYDRFLDPISLATLIVSVATLTWTVYNDQRDRTTEPPPAEVIARQVRIALRERDIILPPETERITEIIATEIIATGTRPDEEPRI